MRIVNKYSKSYKRLIRLRSRYNIPNKSDKYHYRIYKFLNSLGLNLPRCDYKSNYNWYKGIKFKAILDFTDPIRFHMIFYLGENALNMNLCILDRSLSRESLLNLIDTKVREILNCRI